MSFGSVIAPYSIRERDRLNGWSIHEEKSYWHHLLIRMKFRHLTGFLADGGWLVLMPMGFGLVIFVLMNSVSGMRRVSIVLLPFLGFLSLEKRPIGCVRIAGKNVL